MLASGHGEQDNSPDAALLAMSAMSQECGLGTLLGSEHGCAGGAETRACSGTCCARRAATTRWRGAGCGTSAAPSGPPLPTPYPSPVRHTQKCAVAPDPSPGCSPMLKGQGCLTCWPSLRGDAVPALLPRGVAPSGDVQKCVRQLAIPDARLWRRCSACRLLWHASQAGARRSPSVP